MCKVDLRERKIVDLIVIWYNDLLFCIIETVFMISNHEIN